MRIIQALLAVLIAMGAYGLYAQRAQNKAITTLVLQNANELAREGERIESVDEALKKEIKELRSKLKNKE
jgi:cell division protein FtsB